MTLISVDGARTVWRAAKGGVTGHHSGMLAAARTQQELRRARRSAPVDLDAPSRAAARQLHRTGSFRPTVRYPADLIAAMGQGVALADDPATSVAMGGRIPDSVRYAVDPLSLLPRIRELLTPELAGIVRAWYGAEFRISTVRLWRIANIPAEEWGRHHFGNLWHMDGHSVDVLKMFVQISAATDGSAFRFVSRPHTRMALLGGYVDQDRILPGARRFLERNAQIFDQPPGDVVFVDTDRCLHRAGNPAPGTVRGMIQLMFLPARTGPVGGDYFAGIPADPNVRSGATA